MFLKKNTTNLRSLFTVFAVLGLTITALWFGANNSTTNAGSKVGDDSNSPAVRAGRLYDFTGNGRTDFATFTAPTGGSITWKIAANPALPGPGNAFIRIFNYGLSSDTIVPQDYNGDNKTEPTVWRPGSPGIFYVAQFPTGTGGITLDRAVPFGATGDNPNAVGDYDGDGKVDFAVARFAGGVLTYYILTSATNTMRTVPFGLAADTNQFAAVNGSDFNGDGRDELVFLSVDVNNAVSWYAGDAVTGAGVINRQFGDFVSDYAVTPADYTGDGRADFVAVRQTAGGQVWYINNSATNVTTATTFGLSDGATAVLDDRVRGDYDGDGRQDIAVWRRSNQTFYWINSSNGSIQSQQWGFAGDIALGRLGIF